MARASSALILGCVVLLTAGIALSSRSHLLAQRQSPAAGPWSGQAQCVVVAKWADYLDEQMHTWRLAGTAPAPAPAGSSQVYYTWPATWTVQGSGRKTFQSRTPAAGGEQSERWTIASEMNATLRITEIAGTPERLRIGADGQRGAPLGSIRVTEVSGRTRDASVQPWPFPTIEDDAARTTISGSSTRTYPEGFGVGWGQPPKAVTTATCTWSFTRSGVEQSSANPPAGGRGVRERPPIAGVVLATPASETPASGPNPITTTPGGGGGTPSATQAAATTTRQTPASSQPSGDSPSAAATAGGVRLGTAVECTTPGPDVEPTVSPTSVRFAWRSFAGATGYVIADRNGNPLTPSPTTQLTYTHNAAHNHSFSYSYSVTALLASGGCAITRLTFTPPPPLTPRVTAQVIVDTEPGRVRLTWGDQADQPDYYLLLGPGIPPGGAEVTARRSGQIYEVAQLPAGTHRWSVMPAWRAPDQPVGDADLAANVSATVAPVKTPSVEPLTIGLAGFAGLGTWVPVKPPMITIAGWAGTVPATTVAPPVEVLAHALQPDQLLAEQELLERVEELERSENAKSSLLGKWQSAAPQFTAQTSVMFRVTLNLSQLPLTIARVGIFCEVRSSALIAAASVAALTRVAPVNGEVHTTATVVVPILRLDNPVGKAGTYMCRLLAGRTIPPTQHTVEVLNGQEAPVDWGLFGAGAFDSALRMFPSPAALTGNFVWEAPLPAAAAPASVGTTAAAPHSQGQEITQEINHYTSVTFNVPLNLSQLPPEIARVGVTCEVRSPAMIGMASVSASTRVAPVDGHVRANAKVVVPIPRLDNPVGKTGTYVCRLLAGITPPPGPQIVELRAGQDPPMNWALFSAAATEFALRMFPDPAALGGSFGWVEPAPAANAPPNVTTTSPGVNP